MTLHQILKETGFPVAYYQFNKEVEPPFIVHFSPLSDNLIADNKVYLRKDILQVELYTDKKSTADEDIVEAVLNTHKIEWDKTKTYIESENLYQIIYETEEIK